MIQFEILLISILRTLVEVAGLALFVLIEKLAPAGHWIGRAAGAGLIVWGVATLTTL